MSIGGSVALIVIGAILRFAVTYHAKYINIQAIGVILMIGGAAGLVASIALVVSRRRERRPPTEVIERRRYTEPPR
jgi:Zn-dependent protease with chaperone function